MLSGDTKLQYQQHPYEVSGRKEIRSCGILLKIRKAKKKKEKKSKIFLFNVVKKKKRKKGSVYKRVRVRRV